MDKHTLILFYGMICWNVDHICHTFVRQACGKTQNLGEMKSSTCIHSFHHKKKKKKLSINVHATLGLEFAHKPLSDWILNKYQLD